MTSTEVVKIVDRDARKEHGELKNWDYIRLNPLREVDAVRRGVVQRPNLASIVKVQALIRGFIARRNKPKGPAWKMIFDFIVHQNDKYYLVRAYEAPGTFFETMYMPYQIVVTRYMHAQDDQFKLRLENLPYEGESCRQDMIDSIVITQDNSMEGRIREVTFKPLGKRAKVIAPKEAPVGEEKKEKELETEEVVEKQPLIEEEMKDEFISDWKMPDAKSMGRFEIRKFTIQALLPKLSKQMPDTFVTLIVTFGFAQNERKNYFFVQVIYQPRPSFKQTSELHW